MKYNGKMKCNLNFPFAFKFPKISFDHLFHAWKYFTRNNLNLYGTGSKYFFGNRLYRSIRAQVFMKWRTFQIRPKFISALLAKLMQFSPQAAFQQMNGSVGCPPFYFEIKNLPIIYRKSLNSLDLSGPRGEILWNWCVSAFNVFIRLSLPTSISYMKTSLLRSKGWICLK